MSVAATLNDWKQTLSTMRFPIRWRWMALVSVTVALAVLILSLILLDMERDAWLRSQATQAKIMVERLGDEVKSFMLAGRKLDKTQVDIIVSGFREKVPTVLGIQVRYAGDELRDYGEIGTHPALKSDQAQSTAPARRLSEDLWYVQPVTYAETPVGSIAVRFSGDEWRHLANRFIAGTLMVAVMVILLASVAAYLIATRMSRPLEALALAARHVADGDFSIRIALAGNDEITDAGRQFNHMVSELAHKEKLRDVFGRYLNPKLVSDVFSEQSEVPPSHRQQVSILFADMVGFTAFSENTPSEEVVQVLNRHFELFHRIIDYYGGHVDKYIGDAVMAVFNHPHQDEAHVRHAAMAGMAITQACRRLGENRKDATEIQFRVGINHGEAIVGNIGAVERLEYTVIGDAVNVASRMGGLGEGGEVIMPRSSYELVGQGIAFKSIGRKAVKGIQKPINCGKELYLKTASLWIGSDLMQKNAARLDLILRQRRINHLIAQRRKEDAQLLDALNHYSPPKGLDPRDAPYIREFERMQDRLLARGRNAWRAAKRELHEGHPEIAYVEAESYQRLRPGSRRAPLLMQEVRKALPKGLRIPRQDKHRRHSAIVPKSASLHEIRQMMQQGQWKQAHDYAVVYRREGGEDADALLQSINKVLKRQADAAFKAGQTAFRNEQLDKAVEHWSMAAELQPDNRDYSDSLHRARELQERFRILQRTSGKMDR